MSNSHGQSAVTENTSNISSDSDTAHEELHRDLLRTTGYDIFKQIDHNSDGRIATDDLEAHFRSHGVEYDEGRLRDMIAHARTSDHRDYLTLEEFQQLLTTLPTNIQKGHQTISIYPTHAAKVESQPGTELNARSLVHFWYHALPAPRSKTVQAAEAKHSALSNALVTLAAGGIAGGVSRTVVAPLERLKILFQIQSHPPKYTGIAQSIRLILREEGPRGLFRGNAANCVRIIPQQAIQFYSYDQFKKMCMTKDGELTPYRRLAAGALAGATSQFLTYPLDMIRARITIDSTNQYRGMAHALSIVYQKEGPKALFKGIVPSLAGIVPYVGLDFAVYETLKEMPVIPKDSRGQPTVLAKLFCGGVAGLVGQTVAYPLDVVRRRLQIQGSGNITAMAGAQQYNGMVDCFVKTVRQDGFRGLYRGLLPNYLKAVPAVATAFVVYEASLEQLTALRDKV